jgi:NAD(P)-dependent dehydrogenase (short-subunit alcohol dehydrogenase family)
MDLRLQGKYALVTGGSSGIGEGIALALAQEGVSVIIHGRERSKAGRVAEAIEALGGTAFVVEGDLATDEGADQMISQALAVVEGIDILVNNVGRFGFQGWAPATPEE